MPPFGNEQDSTLSTAPETPTSENEEATEGAETEQEQPEGILGEGEDGEEPEGGEGEGDGAPGEFEEVEFDGERYAVPAKLKDAFLRQSDYTRKTQEVAEQRRQVEEAQKFILAEHKALEAETQERGDLAYVNKQIAQYENVDWRAYELQNPVDAQAHWRQFSLLKERRDQIKASLTEKARERSETAARDHANRTAKALQELADPVKGIKGWSPATANAITEFAVSQGYTREELSGIADSRPIKILHQAMLYQQLMAKQKSAPRVQANPSATVKPLKQVSKGASRPAATSAPSDKDSDEAWLQKRRAQLLKKSA